MYDVKFEEWLFLCFWDDVSFGAHSLSRPVYYYKIGVCVRIRVCVLHNAVCYRIPACRVIKQP